MQGAVPFSNAKYGQGTGIVQIDYVQCNGTETKLNDCQKSEVGAGVCAHRDDVGVRCQG